MCLGVPLKVLKVKEHETALVSIGDSYMEISTVFTPDVREGDYVIVHAGFSISILNRDEAEEISSLLKEVQLDS